jgi:hypothetical protein
MDIYNFHSLHPSLGKKKFVEEFSKYFLIFQYRARNTRDIIVQYKYNICITQISSVIKI